MRKYSVLVASVCSIALMLPAAASAYKTTTPWGSPALTYGFLNGTSDIAGTAEQQTIRDAMHLWHTVSKVTFTENTANPSLAQIRLKWATGEHGDASPFDGTSNCLGKGHKRAHGFFPKESESGDVHFDDDELWTTEPSFECQPIDLMSVALHEIGHSLGLEHVEDEGSIMYENYLGTRRDLDIDDILGIQSLYGFSTGLFHLRHSNSEGPPGITFRYGIVLGGKPVIGDWEGGGNQTIGSYYPPNHSFYLRNSNSPGAADFEFECEWCKSEDLPIAGDWDGDGDQTIGVFRPSNATFYLNNQNANNSVDYTIAYGAGEDTPVAGDWNGDGVDSIGVYRPSQKKFYLRNENSEGSSDYEFAYGLQAAIPIVGDWNEDEVDTIGLYNPSDSSWALRNNNSTGAADLYFYYGDGGEFTPVTGDWDGSGDSTVGLFQG